MIVEFLGGPADGDRLAVQTLPYEFVIEVFGGFGKLDEPVRHHQCVYKFCGKKASKFGDPYYYKWIGER